MANALEEYKEAVNAIATTNAPEMWEGLDWTPALEKVTSKAILEDAQRCAVMVCNNLVVLPATIGPVKQLHRVEQKKGFVANTGYPSFKAICDLGRMRVELPLEDIPSMVMSIQKKAKRYGFTVCVRDGLPLGTQASIDAGGKLRFHDIVQMLYVHFDGHIVEIQVMEPLAAYTFAVDSALRAQARPNDCGPVKVWTDGLYVAMRTHMLERANKEPVSQCASDILLLCQRVYTSRNLPIPKELLAVFCKWVCDC